MPIGAIFFKYDEESKKDGVDKLKVAILEKK